ncbi:DUF7533 family protein [Haloarcula sediminis]|uniref:DUF7533 family protein n=1 Tax=Haloarcula sediminis TaxID=3111777 RepID=UPI002D78E399|nr:hypothetical protein [Haloarcula sp. CK38]
MARGILETIGLAATLVLAIPIALFGAEHLVRGELLAGALYVGIAVGLVVVEQYLTTPTDVPGMVAEKTVGKVAETEDTETETTNGE